MNQSYENNENYTLIFDKIKMKQSAGIRFFAMLNCFEKYVESSNTGFTDSFIKPEEVTVLKFASHNFIDLDSEAIEIKIPSLYDTLELILVKVPDDFYNYRLVTNTGEKFESDRKIKHYRGIVKNDSGSMVSISVYGNFIQGLILTDSKSYTLFTNKEEVSYLYEDNNLREKNKFACGNHYEGKVHYNPEILLANHRKDLLTKKPYCIELYLETDYGIYEFYESISWLEFSIISLFNQLALVYAEEGVRILLSELYVWTSPDPYTGTNVNGFLSQFQSVRTSFNGDLGQLLTFKGFVGHGGKAAMVGGLCNSSVSNRLSVARIQTFHNLFPTFSWSVFIMAHEFGHLLGSEHTHACVWNGNNTAIDDCESTEGGCFGPTPAPNEGTIMSYCTNSVGVNLALGFGTQPGNVIRNFIDNASCIISKVISGPNMFCDSASFTAINLPAGGVVESWEVFPDIHVTLTEHGNSCTVTRVLPTNSEITLTAHLNVGCRNYKNTKKVWIGVPVIDFLEPHNSANDHPYFCVSHGGNSFELITYGGYGTGSVCEIQLLSYPSLTLLYTQISGLSGPWTFIPAAGWYVFKARIINHACGLLGDWAEFEVEFVDCSF